MFGQEMVTCLTVAGATMGFKVWAGQRSLERQHITSGTAFFACGLLTLVFLVIAGSMLAQVMLLIPGVMCVGESREVIRGSASARRRALYSSAFILVVALPVIGLYASALLLTVSAGSAILVHEGARRSRRPAMATRPSAQAEPSALAAESCY
jgi:hypothetical protein